MKVLGSSAIIPRTNLVLFPPRCLIWRHIGVPETSTVPKVAETLSSGVTAQGQPSLASFFYLALVATLSSQGSDNLSHSSLDTVW